MLLSALSKDLISDVMHSESEDLNEDVVIVEEVTDSNSECECEATQSHGVHMLLSCVICVQQCCTDLTTMCKEVCK